MRRLETRGGRERDTGVERPPATSPFSAFTLSLNSLMSFAISAASGSRKYLHNQHTLSQHLTKCQDKRQHTM